MEEREQDDWKGAADDMESDVQEMERQTERFSEGAKEHEQTWESRKDDEQAPGAADPDDHMVSVDTERAKQQQQEEERQRQEEEEQEEEDEGPPEQSAGGKDDEDEDDDE